MIYTRREIGQIALATLAAPALFPRTLAAQVRDAKFNGVTLGTQTYSFRAINNPATRIIAAMKDIGIWEAELMSGDAENLAGMPTVPNFGRGGGGGARPAGPPAAGAAPTSANAVPAAAPPTGAAPAAPAGGGGQGRGRGTPLTPEQQAEVTAAQAAQVKWRMSTSPATWAAVRKQWNDAGIDVRFLCYNMGGNMTDDLLEYGFQMAKGLGVRAISTSTQVPMAKRIAPFADKHNMIVAVHGHASVDDPTAISTEATFLACFAESKNIWANLDIGHYTATDADPVAFLQKHHGRITNLHIKDRKNKTNGGANTAFGQGDTNIKGVMQLLKTQKWDIAANVEFEYMGDPLVEMPKCMQYMRDALA